MKLNNRGESEVLETMGLAILVIGVIAALMFLLPIWNVWRAGLSGEAELNRAEQTRQILVAQAQGEKDAARLRADAIAIVGQAAKDFPEYRTQEFLGAFAEALREGHIAQIMYIPTEAGIPITEAGRAVPRVEKGE